MISIGRQLFSLAEHKTKIKIKKIERYPRPNYMKEDCIVSTSTLGLSKAKLYTGKSCCANHLSSCIQGQIICRKIVLCQPPL